MIITGQGGADAGSGRRRGGGTPAVLTRQLSNGIVRQLIIDPACSRAWKHCIRRSLASSVTSNFRHSCRVLVWTTASPGHLSFASRHYGLVLRTLFIKVLSIVIFRLTRVLTGNSFPSSYSGKCPRISWNCYKRQKRKPMLLYTSRSAEDEGSGNQPQRKHVFLAERCILLADCVRRP